MCHPDITAMQTVVIICCISKRDFLFLLCVCEFMLEEGHQIPGAGVMGGRELPGDAAGKQTLVFCFVLFCFLKSSKCS